MERTWDRRQAFGVGLALAVATVVVYCRVFGFDFVNLDDQVKVTGNARVSAGLTFDGFIWAFGYPERGHHWNPVTWLSHMLDCELFGLDPWGHHAMNLVLHLINVILLFVLLRRMTGHLWPSAFVAALFAVHPMHVEAVAWVSGRAYLLTAFIMLLSIWAYVAYTRRGGAGRYSITALCFALGLMTKPVLVVLPVVFLLLDYWPLDRIGTRKEARTPAHAANTSRKPFLSLAIEKVPLLALSAIAGVGTSMIYWSRAQASEFEGIALHLREANAVVAYTRYIGKTFWPSDLSVIYPHPYRTGGTPLGPWRIAGAGVLLPAITAWAVVVARRRRYAPVGWFWFALMLLPVIGLVQVGGQAMADRYAYISLIGLFVMIAWGARDLVLQWSSHSILARRVAWAAAGAVLAACMAGAWFQVGYWKDSVTLFERAVAVASDDPGAHNNLATGLYDQGRLADAMPHFRRVLELDPGDAQGHYNLGNALKEQGRLDEAAGSFRRALELKPDHVLAHNNLGNALKARGEVEEAIGHYHRALELDPGYASAHNNWGLVLQSSGRTEEAIHHYRQAVGLDPEFALAHSNLGAVLGTRGEIDAAIEHLEEALRLRPDYAEAHNNLGAIIGSRGDFEGAIRFFKQALELKPDHGDARLNLRAALEAKRRLKTSP